MVKLYLIRHAKSSWDNVGIPDFDRPLNDRGQRDAPQMGKRLRVRGIYPDLMLTSPAVRALTTCQEMATALSYPPNEIKSDKRIYHADADQLLQVINKLNEVKSLMIFGHNPGLTEFANRLLVIGLDNIPTCGIVGAELGVQTWQEISWGCGEMKFFDYPKQGA